jgi:3D (Asp-Asp-Asp) domain-containing protein
MKNLIISLILLTNLKCYSQDFNNTHKYKEHIARVTYYWPNYDGQIGSITSTGVRAVAGKTAAVDPKIIPYKSKIYIPEMKCVLIAADTGAAVKQRTASKKLGKNNIVIDIFCKNRNEAIKLSRKYKMFMNVYIEK